jgi:hypothetical protein
MTRVLTVVLGLAMLCPSLSLGKERQISLKACHTTAVCLAGLASEYADRSQTPSPAIKLADEPYCPEDRPMPNQCRCDHKDTCNIECCEGKFECDNTGYCICRGNC